MISKIIRSIKDVYTPTWQLCRYCNHRIDFGIPASTNASWCLDEQQFAHVECDPKPVCICEIAPPTEEQVSGRIKFIQDFPPWTEQDWLKHERDELSKDIQGIRELLQELGAK